MIVDAIFSFFEAVVGAVMDLVPTINAPDISGWVDGLGPVFGAAGWLNKYVPLDQAGIGLGIVMGSFVVLYGVRVTIWLLTKAHFMGGS